MFKKRNFFLVTLVLVISLAVALGGCRAAVEDDKITFANPEWESIRIHNHIARFIIEQGLGYETDALSGSTPATWESLRRGDAVVYMEVWPDNWLDAYNEALEQEQIVILSVNFDDNAQGLWVPAYMIEGDEERGIEPVAPGLKSVFDLPDYWELFEDPEDPSKGRIIGAIAGWEADEILEVKMDSYELSEHFNYFRPGSHTALAASLKRAYDAGLPWVGYNWEPNWVMELYDLIMLEEPAYDPDLWEDGYRSEFRAVDVTVAVHSSMPDKYPDVVDFLSNYTTSTEITNAMLLFMHEEDASEEEAAMHFLREYEELWTEWVDEDVAASVKAALDQR